MSILARARLWHAQPVRRRRPAAGAGAVPAARGRRWRCGGIAPRGVQRDCPGDAGAGSGGDRGDGARCLCAARPLRGRRSGADPVPTWKHVAVHLRGTRIPLPEAGLHAVLDRLSAQFEAGLLPRQPWTSASMTDGVKAQMMRQIPPDRLDMTGVPGTWESRASSSRARPSRARPGPPPRGRRQHRGSTPVASDRNPGCWPRRWGGLTPATPTARPRPGSYCAKSRGESDATLSRSRLALCPQGPGGAA